MNKTLAIIDGDSLCFLGSKDTIQESIDRVDTVISGIFEATGSTSYYLLLSKGPYFRHSVNEEYKGKRTKSPLKYLSTLKQYLREQYLAEYWKGVEADDAVAYIQQLFLDGKLPEFTNTFVCSLDKDVKKQVEGNMYDYRKNEFSVTTAEEAQKFLHIQSIMGDSTDNIKGIPGHGPAKATKLIEAAKAELHPLVAYKAYLEHYGEPGYALYEYQKNYRQVYMLRTDSDFQNEVGYVPELNDPINIIK
tara:strand:- start:18820 stop:19563 length:744 start_codon:yes stop_codon:yes gene_type:complete